MANSFDKKTALLLSRPLPKEAVSDKKDARGLSSIKSIYITERLNEVFGIGGWSFTVSDGEGVAWTQSTTKGERQMYKGLIKGRLELSNGAVYEAVASSDNSDEGDAMKGAGTDALTKMCSWLGIAAYVYKNQTHEQATAEWNALWAAFNAEEIAKAEAITVLNQTKSNAEDWLNKALPNSSRDYKSEVWKANSAEQVAEIIGDAKAEIKMIATAKSQEFYNANIGKVSEAVQKTLAQHIATHGIIAVAKDLHSLINAAE